MPPFSKPTRWQGPKDRDISLSGIRIASSDVVNAIVHSLDKSAKPLGSSKEGHEPSLDFVESRRRLQKELVSPDSSSKRRRRKLREFQRTVEAVLVDPLHERAAAEPSLSERSRLAALAEANRTTHLHQQYAQQEWRKRSLRKACVPNATKPKYAIC